MTTRRRSVSRSIRLPRNAVLCQHCGVAKSPAGSDEPCLGKFHPQLREGGGE